ncbi:MAG TPA: leucyl-tRNA--protein transferase [Treponema sp.]|nr:leucyl-tRNA--protein transferase [Treponema sp.]
MLLEGDDPDAVADSLLAAGYREEFCLSPSFDPDFIASLMDAGFLVMAFASGGSAILLPKLHLERAVLDFTNLHEGRTARRLSSRYELAPDEDFDAILERCAAVHGEDWLIPELRAAFRSLRHSRGGGLSAIAAGRARMASFALRMDGNLVAGEFGVVIGRVYTSYSGFTDAKSAGTVQLVKTGLFLREADFAVWDLGMPMGYKDRLGAHRVGRADFIRRFRQARASSARIATG